MKNINRFNLVVGVIAFLMLVVGVFFYFSRDGAQQEEDAGVFPARNIPEGWREYQSNWYDFSLLYPAELTVRELGESASINTNTVVFENAEKGIGFQIFSLPYAGEQVTQERFLMDVPSGVRTDLKEFLIGTTTVTSFYSKSAELGDTFEIWFIHGGILYEVTTTRAQEAWFSEIFKTWVFI